MKNLLDHILIVFIGFFSLFLLTKCSSLDKIRPEYKGVDPKLQKYVKEYKELAKMQGITFKNDVTIGFKRLHGDTVGLTTYGIGWREIDISTDFWDNSTSIEKWNLAFHELSHAYCARKHDFGNGTLYPEYDTWENHKPPEIGRYKDGSRCPLSLLFPEILDDCCMYLHYNDYIKEMFNRCSNW